MAKTKVTTPDGKSFLITHKDGVSKDTLAAYVNNVAYPRAAAEEAGPFDFIVDAFTVAKSGAVRGFEEAAGGLQQGAANIARYGANAYYDLLDDLYQDAENKERVKVGRERTLRDINQYEDVGEMMREPVQKFAQEIRNSRFLEQDNVAANVALEVIETVARMAPVLTTALLTKQPVAGISADLLNGAQAMSEAKRDMEQALGKGQEEFTLEERQQLANVTTAYAAGSTLLFKFISKPALGLDKVSGDTLRKFLKGEIKLPAGKLKSLLNVVKAGGGEAIEETAQGQFLDTLAAFSYDDDRKLVGKEVLNERMHEAMIAFFAGGSIRGVGEIGGAIGNMKLPTAKTQEVSEEQRKGMKTFRVKYTATQKEKGREDAVFDREDTFEAKSLEEAQQIIDESVKKKPGVDAESIVIEEVQPTVEPEVKDDTDFLDDSTLSNQEKIQKYYESLTDEELERMIKDEETAAFSLEQFKSLKDEVTKPDVYEAELAQEQKSYERTKKNAERAKAVLEARKQKPVIDEEPITEVTKIQQELAELADVFAAEMETKGSAPEIRKQIQAKEAELKVAEEAQAKARQEARDAEVKVETDRILKEQKQRIAQGKPLFDNFGVFSDVDLETTDLTTEQKAEITELRNEARTEAKNILQSLEDPTGQLDTEAIKKGLDALEDPTGALDTQAVAEGLEALRQLSEEGTVGATAGQQQVFDKIREIERRQAEILGREYIPRTDASIVREIRDTIVRTPMERATPTFFVGATMSPVSSQFDSSRVGTSKKGTKARPVTTTQEDNIDSEIVPDKLLEKQMDKIDYQHLPENIKNETDPKTKYEKLVEYIKNNLIALHNKFPEDLRAQATLWYDGARKIAENLAERYDLTAEQVGGILAVLSPQKQWFMNIAQAEQVIHTMRFYQDFKIEGADIDAEIESIIKGTDKKDRAARRKILDKVKGKTIKQLRKESDYLAGWAIRLISQAKYGRYYNVVNPDGTILGFDAKQDGNPRKNSWGAIAEIEKAMSIMDNGSLDNISEQLGDQHKVRNFNNNIVAPNSPYGDATIDTHAVAAGLLMPLGASAIEVKHNFGQKMPSSGASGISGNYHMYLEAYRRAAKELGIQPRQMQSITWEAIRLLYPSELRTKDSIDKATKIHNNSRNEQEARDTILRPEISRPSWSTTGDIRELTTVPAAAEGLGSDNVLGGDLQFRGRRTQRDAVVGATEQEAQTNAERSVIGSAVSDAQKLAEKLDVKIEESTTINRPAQYNYETQTIQYNPRLLASRGKEFSKAAMREEIIHAAMHKVIMRRNPKLSAKAAFEKAMSSIGSDLTQEQKDLMSEVYGELGTDLNYGAEYTRFAVQHILDGKTTEGTLLFSGKAFERLQSLIKSVQSYVTKILGPELKTNEEAAFIIADTLRLLRSVDPDAKPAQQKIISEAEAILSGTAQVDSYVYDNPYASEAEKKRRISETKRRKRAAVLQTASSFFKRIHGDIATLISDYYTRLERRQTDAVRQINNFQTKIRGIKNEKDRNRLKQLFSSTSDPNTADGRRIFGERDNLLRKYNLYNDFKLLIRPLLDQLRLEAIASGMDVKYLFEYFPMKVKDLGGLLSLYGKDIENDFDAQIKKINKERKDNGELELNEDEIAAQFIVYLNNQMYKENLGEKTPGFLKKRKGGMLSQEELKFYEDPEVALGSYVNSIIVKTEEARMFGNKALQRNKEMELDGESTYRVNLSDPQGELSRLVARLYSEGQLDKRQMGDLFFGLDQMFGPPIKGKEQESNMRQFGRLASYGSLLVDPTTTLSQLYDLAFMALDNPNVLRIAKTIVTKKDFSLEMAGIDPTLMSAEFRPNNEQRQRRLEKGVKFMLKTVGFTQLDKLMKETNLTVNYNRYRRISKKPKNSKEFKKFRSEVEFMVGPQDVERTINDFRNGVYDSPYVRELVVRKLLETQPVNAFEMPMAIRKNPNLRMWYTMKSFIIKQANLVNDRMISKILSRTASREEKKKAIFELIYLIFLFQMAGIPIDFIKDMIAGRDVYPEDYVENAFFRLFGMSKYNMYILKERGPAEFGISYFAPVPVMQAYELSKQIYFGGKKVFEGEFESEDAQKIARTLLPYDSLWYYGYGPGAESQRERRTRESRERGRVPLIYGDPVLQFNPETLINLNLGPRETNIYEPIDLAPYFRNQ